MAETTVDESTRLFYTKRGKEIDLDKVELWASRHLTIENMAALMGMNRATIYELAEENQQFQQNFYAAIESGKAQGVEMVANKLLELCQEGHPQSIYFFLERKGGFAKTDNGIPLDTPKNDEPVVITVVDARKRADT